MDDKKKKIIGIIAAVLVIIGVLIIFMVSCGNNNNGGTEDETTGEIITEAVTDQKGELVTDESGEVVTQIVQAEVVTKDSGEKETEAVTNKKGETVTKDNGEKVTQSVTKKPSKPVEKVELEIPKAVKNLKVAAFDTNTVTLKWSRVKNCDGYVVDYCIKGSNSWSLPVAVDKTQYKIENLESGTAYTFRVRAYNGIAGHETYCEYGKEATVDQQTKINEVERKIAISVFMPNTQSADTLEIYVNDVLVHTEDVTCDGSTFTFETPDTYKGVVKVNVKLAALGYDEFVETDKEVAEINFADNQIDYIEGGLV